MEQPRAYGSGGGRGRHGRGGARMKMVGDETLDERSLGGREGAMGGFA